MSPTPLWQQSLVTLWSNFEQVFAAQHHNKSQDVSSGLKKDELQLQKNLSDEIFCVAGVAPSAPPHVIPFSEEVDIWETTCDLLTEWALSSETTVPLPHLPPNSPPPPSLIFFAIGLIPPPKGWCREEKIRSFVPPCVFSAVQGAPKALNENY